MQTIEPEQLPRSHVTELHRETSATSLALLDEETLKKRYLECLRAAETVTATLKNTVLALLRFGADWRDLVQWAASAGFRSRCVRRLLSEILLEAGIRRRKHGSGPKTPLEALAIMASVRDQYGFARARKLLRAAAHAADAEARAQNEARRHNPYPVQDKAAA
jgi:hypothetical protein